MSLSNRKKVWCKGHIIDGHPADIWRRDAWGNIINWQEFGDSGAKYGWGISNVSAPKQGEESDINKMQPIHWKMIDDNGRFG